MPMYNLIEYSDKPDKASFKYKQKIQVKQEVVEKKMFK